MTLESLQESLQEYRGSLVDVEAMIEEGATVDLLQMRADIWESIQDIEGFLAEMYESSRLLGYISSTRGLSNTQGPTLSPAPVQPVSELSESRHETAGDSLENPPAIGALEPLSAKRVRGGEEGEPPGREAKRGRKDPQIHPRNVYAAEEPNFAKLAEKDSLLREYVTVDGRGRGRLDFTDANACRELTRALLHHDYGISWQLQPSQLIPAVTNRANYIHWLQDLLLLSAPPGTARGLDIGCGANLVYCLLGASVCGWQVVGVDVTPEAERGAQQNLEANPHLSSLIELRMRPEGAGDLSQGVLLPAINTGESFAFSMCNPPFFASREEAGRNPGTDFQGSDPEMVCPGGELAFVSQMVQDSLKLRERVHWYTSMVGKKATLKAVRQQLQQIRVPALRVTEFAQGRTSRWGIAWSFSAAAQATETAPLPRTDAQPRPLIAKRTTSFRVDGKLIQPRSILETLEGILSAVGASCKPDYNGFSLSAQLPVPQDSKEEGPDLTGEHVTISIRLVVERPGVYAVQAKSSQQSSPEAATLFTATLQKAEQDLKQILGLR